MKAQITVFLSMCLSSFILLVVSLCLICITLAEGVRAQGSLDLSLNSVLGEYSKALKEEYDLYYIDASYLNTEPDIQNVEDRIRWYLDQNLIDNLSKEYSPWSNICINSVELNKFSASTAGGGASMKYQAAESMYREGKESSHDAEIRYVYAQGDLALMENIDDVLSRWDQLMEVIDGMPLPLRYIEEKDEYEEIPLNNPANGIYGICHSEILYLAGVDINGVSNSNVDTQTLISKNLINEEAPFDSKNASDEVYIAYLLEHMGSYMHEKDNRALSLELEYIISGHNSDYENFTSVVNRIYAERLFDNFSLAMNDSRLWSEARMIATALEVCTLSPEFIEPVATSLVYATAFMETVSDISTIMNEGRVRLHKLSSDMSVIKALSGGVYDTNDPSGLSYTEYLVVMLILIEDRIRNLRSMDLMELWVRGQTGDSFFSMGWCIEKIGVQISYKDSMNNSHTLNRIYGYY